LVHELAVAFRSVLQLPKLPISFAPGIIRQVFGVVASVIIMASKAAPQIRDACAVEVHGRMERGRSRIAHRAKPPTVK
jgi:hypothetical protein